MLKTLIEAFALISTWEVIIAMFAADLGIDMQFTNYRSN